MDDFQPIAINAYAQWGCVEPKFQKTLLIPNHFSVEELVIIADSGVSLPVIPAIRSAVPRNTMKRQNEARAC